MRPGFETKFCKRDGFQEEDVECFRGDQHLNRRREGPSGLSLIEKAAIWYSREGVEEFFRDPGLSDVQVKPLNKDLEGRRFWE